MKFFLPALVVGLSDGKGANFSFGKRKKKKNANFTAT